MKKNIIRRTKILHMRIPEVIDQMLIKQATSAGVSKTRFVQMLIERENAKGVQND